MKRILLCSLLGLFFFGCATISHVVSPPPEASDLYYDEDDVKKVVERLSRSDIPDDVSFDGENYIVGEDTMNKLVTKGIIAEVQKEKINEFVKDYERPTFLGSAKKDAGTSIFTTILILLLGASFL